MADLNVDFTSGDVLEVGLDTGGLVTLGNDQAFQVSLGEVTLSTEAGFITAYRIGDTLYLQRRDGSVVPIALPAGGSGEGQTTIYPDVDLNRTYKAGEVFAFDGSLIYVTRDSAVDSTWSDQTYRSLVRSASNASSAFLLITVDTLLDLEDTPDSYGGKAGYVLQVNADETGVAFVELPEFQTGQATVGTEQRTVYHDPRRIAGTDSDPLHTAIADVALGSGNLYDVYATRPAGSFVAEDDFMAPTVEEKVISGETHKLFVVSFPGDYKDYTYLNVEFNDNIAEISKSSSIPLQTLINTTYDGVDPALAFGRLKGETFDWVLEDSRAQEDENKRELRITLAYDEDTDTSYVKFHQEPVANEATAAIYLFIAYFVKEVVDSIKGDVGPQGIKGDIGPRGDKGDTGSMGLQGEQGIQGNVGPQGPQGPQGNRGTDGADGDDGDTGPKGEDGEDGATGRQGAQGQYRIRLYARVAHDATAPTAPTTATYDGTTIRNIPSGWQEAFFSSIDESTYDYYSSFSTYNPASSSLGDWSAPYQIEADIGLTGPSGPAGQDGAQGERGIPGVPGEKGDTGLTGPRGAQGLQGPVGPQGEQGEKGDTGEQGEIGPAGDSGISTSYKKGIFLHPDITLSRTTLSDETEFRSVITSIAAEDADYVNAQDSVTGDEGLLVGNYAVETINVNGVDYDALKLTLKDEIQKNTFIAFDTSGSVADQASSRTVMVPGLLLSTSTLENNKSIKIGYEAVQFASPPSLNVISNGDKEIYVYQEETDSMYLWEINALDIEGGTGPQGIFNVALYADAIDPYETTAPALPDNDWVWDDDQSKLVRGNGKGNSDANYSGWTADVPSGSNYWISVRYWDPRTDKLINAWVTYAPDTSVRPVYLPGDDGVGLTTTTSTAVTNADGTVTVTIFLGKTDGTTDEVSFTVDPEVQTDTAAQIVAKLESLSGSNRLSAVSVRDILDQFIISKRFEAGQLIWIPEGEVIELYLVRSAFTATDVKDPFSIEDGDVSLLVQTTLNPGGHIVPLGVTKAQYDLLDTKITAETTARTSADTALQNQIDAIDTSGGGLATVATDDSLTGDGSADDPLSVATAPPSTFTDLTDTPSSIQADKFLRGNSAGSALVWTDAPSGGATTVVTPESYKDVYIDQTTTGNDPTSEGNWLTGGSANDLDVGTAQPTPSGAGAAYKRMNIAISHTDYNKMDKVELYASHATAVLFAQNFTILKADIDSGSSLLVAGNSHATTNRAITVQLFKNQSQTGTTSSTTHRLMLEAPAWATSTAYVGRVRLVTNQRGGPKGNDGADGLDGLPGPKGDAGDDGRDGRDGIPGAKGDRGERGEQGSQGPAGTDGTDGKDGVDGAAGPQGLRGATGATGPRGAQGEQGLRGEQGVQGDQGIPGVKGDTGETGSRGPQGDTGAKGDIGGQGHQGAFQVRLFTQINSSGAGSLATPPATPDDGWEWHEQAGALRRKSGSSSTDGNYNFWQASVSGITVNNDGDIWVVLSQWNPATGNTSTWSDPIATDPEHAQAIAGIPGKDGVDGARGPQGAKGDKGDKGDTGATGNTGPQGIRGPQGVQGGQGIPGVKGDDGDDGSPGAQGLYLVRLYRRVSHGATAPATPTGAVYNGIRFTTVPSGWQATFFTSLDEATYDYYESFSSFNPSNNSLGGWSSPFKVGADLGPAGPSGPKGDKGDTGVAGPTGSVGPKGNTGPKGPQGVKGDKGLMGDVGPGDGGIGFNALLGDVDDIDPIVDEVLYDAGDSKWYKGGVTTDPGTSYLVQRSGELFSLNTTNADITFLGEVSLPANIADSFYYNNTSYVATVVNTIYSINVSTQSYTLVARIPASQFSSGSAHIRTVTEHQGKLYAVVRLTTESTFGLFEINITNATARLIAKNGGLGFDSMASHNGVLYAGWDTNDTLYSVNTTDGSATVLQVYFGISRPSFHILNSYNNNLYAMNISGSLWLVNTTDYTATLLGRDATLPDSFDNSLAGGFTIIGPSVNNWDLLNSDSDITAALAEKEGLSYAIWQISQDSTTGSVDTSALQTKVKFYNASTTYKADDIFDLGGAFYRVRVNNPTLTGLNDTNAETFVFKQGNTSGPLDKLNLSEANVDSKITTATPNASTTVRGKVELATSSEARGGQDNVRAVTALGVGGAIRATPISSLSNVPSISGQGGKFLAVDRAGANVELVDAPSGGSGGASLASDSEFATGTDTKAPTVNQIKAYADANAPILVLYEGENGAADSAEGMTIGNPAVITGNNSYDAANDRQAFSVGSGNTNNSLIEFENPHIDARRVAFMFDVTMNTEQWNVWGQIGYNTVPANQVWDSTEGWGFAISRRQGSDPATRIGLQLNFGRQSQGTLNNNQITLKNGAVLSNDRFISVPYNTTIDKVRCVVERTGRVIRISADGVPYAIAKLNDTQNAIPTPTGKFSFGGNAGNAAGMRAYLNACAVGNAVLRTLY